MTLRSAPTSDALSAWVQQDFGVEITTLSPVEHGAEAAAQLWRGCGADGASYAVKLSGAGTPAGLIVSAHLAEHGVAGVPRPLMGAQGQPWSEREGRRLSVVPWVSEARALEGEMSAAHWTSYGALLAKVHATTVTDELATSLPREDHHHEQAASATRALDRSLRLVAEEPEAGRTADALVHALAQEWCAAGDRVLALLDRANYLGRELQARKAPNVVCHGDPHLGNVLIGQDDRVWLIDWDDSVLAPPERDLIFILGGVLAFAPVTPQQQAWFFEGYGATSPDPSNWPTTDARVPLKTSPARQPRSSTCTDQRIVSVPMPCPSCEECFPRLAWSPSRRQVDLPPAQRPRIPLLLRQSRGPTLPPTR